MLVMHANKVASYNHTRGAQITAVILLGLLRPRDYTQNAPCIILSPSENMTYSLGLKNTFQTLGLKPSGLKGIFHPSGIRNISLG